MLNIAVDSNPYCVGKITKHLYEKTAIVAGEEKYSDFKAAVHEINSLESFRRLQAKNAIVSIPDTSVFYLKSKIKYIIRNTAKRVVYK